MHGLLAGEHKTKPLPGLGCDIGLVLPPGDVVFKILFLGDKRGFLTFQAVEMRQIVRIGIEGGHQLDGRHQYDEQRDEEGDRTGIAGTRRRVSARRALAVPRCVGSSRGLFATTGRSTIPCAHGFQPTCRIRLWGGRGTAHRASECDHHCTDDTAPAIRHFAYTRRGEAPYQCLAPSVFVYYALRVTLTWRCTSCRP